MIDEITANITTINEVPLRSEESSEISYRTKVENFLKAVKRFSIELKTLISQLRLFTNQTNDTTEYINTARLQSEHARNVAVEAKNRVESLVGDLDHIVYPAGTTYEVEEIDEITAELANMIMQNTANINNIKIEGVNWWVL